MTEDEFDELVDDATYAVNNCIPAKHLENLSSTKRTQLLHAINDALTPLLRNVFQPDGEGDQ